MRKRMMPAPTGARTVQKHTGYLCVSLTISIVVPTPTITIRRKKCASGLYRGAGHGCASDQKQCGMYFTSSYGYLPEMLSQISLAACSVCYSHHTTGYTGR